MLDSLAIMDRVHLVAGAAVALCLFFDFSNGFNDSANQVATAISSRALSPEAALILASAAEFIGAYFLGTSVAKTIGKGIVDPDLMRAMELGIFVLMSAVLGALAWNLFAWYHGLPSSSSHALIGGLVGAFLSGWGPGPVQWASVRDILGVMLAAPLAGFLLTYLMTKLTFFLSQGVGPRVNVAFKKLQVAALVVQSLAHGTNDAQKTMGVITFALILTNLYRPPAGPEAFVPHWVVLACSLAMAFGVAVGGWRIIRTLGGGFFRVRPVHGFAAQSTSAAVMYLTAALGFPVSTTQVISSSILGAGAAFRPKSVRWAVAQDMLLAWLVTIPAAGLVAAASFRLIRFILT